MNNCRLFPWAKVFLCQLIAVSIIFAQFTRQHSSISSQTWKFTKSNPSGAQGTAFNDAGWQSVTIPHDFNGGIDKVNNDVFNGPSMYRGIGWYRTHFTMDAKYQGKKVFIEFGAVSLVADVYVNGTLLGQHKGGYTDFSFDMTSAVVFGGDNVLAVKANSANDPKVAPWMQTPFGTYPTSYDYAVYGGIYRDVWINVTDPAKIEATFVTTPGVSAASSQVRVKTEVQNYGAAAQSVTLTTIIVDAAGATVTSLPAATQSITAGQTYTFDQTSSAIANPHLWSPSSPYLYKVKSTLSVSGAETDQFESPLGFRWYTMPKSNGQFTLNGQPLFLQGVNRHQDWKGLGWALTAAQHRYDMQLIKNGGFNFVRHAHYPADQEAMKACDELGLLSWLEVPVTVSISTDPEFLNSAKSQLTEMIRQNFNHPSVVIWSIGNESDQAAGSAQPALTESYTNSFNAALNALAHQLDATRATAGSNFKLASDQAIPDIYSPHVFLGWYSGVYTSYNPTLFTSEYGGDADVNIHKEPGTQVVDDWSQEYQCLLHEAFVARGQAVKTQFTGQCLWVMFDFASPRADRVIGPNSNTINYMNQKGLFLADHTTPKDAYFFYKSFFTSGATAPMVYIVSHTWLNRWTAAAAKTVWVYSNCDQVELFNAIGSQSLGKQSRTAGESTVKTRFQWTNANVKYNVLYAEGIVGGSVVTRDTIILKNLPAPPASGTSEMQNRAKAATSRELFFTSSLGAYTLATRLPAASLISLSLFNVDGSMVAVPSSRGSAQVNVGRLARGVYYAHAVTGSASWTQKLIVQ
jgi:beta-galactosidase